MKVAKKVLKKYGNKVKFIRAFSEKAAKLIEDNSLDFAYIDGNHQYEFVKKDIELYYPKVKKGGIVGGDDYTSSPETETEKFSESRKFKSIRINPAQPYRFLLNPKPKTA